MDVRGVKSSKEVRLGWGKGRRSHVSVIREHYLRDDISCGSRHCSVCPEPAPSAGMLGSELKRYVIPDAAALVEFIDVFEHPGVTGLIFLQTCISRLRLKFGRRAYRRLLQTVELAEKSSIVFANEHHIECFSERQPSETVSHWQQRLALMAALWYHNHLNRLSGKWVELVLLTEHKEEYQELCHERDLTGIQLFSVSEYLLVNVAQPTNILELALSVMDARSSRQEDARSRDFSEHLPKEELREGVLQGRLIQGMLRVNRMHARDEAFISPSPSLYPASSRDRPHPLLVRCGMDSVGDVLIAGSANRNRAIEGDTVAVQLLPRVQWKGRSTSLAYNGETKDNSHRRVSMPTGVVVGIIQRENRPVVASFSADMEGSGQGGRVLVVPYDFRIPKIRINTRLANRLNGHRVVVQVDKWDLGSQYPDGHFLRSIGPIGDIETEIQTILLEHKLSVRPFSQAALLELPSPDSWREGQEREEDKRRDLRDSHLVFSIDPQGCEDVDDALSVRKLKGGRLELGVHIADVSHFVAAGSHLDREAQQKATTLYLADRRYDMLPPVLSANLCSLLGGVDRYAVSIMWKMDSRCEVQKVWYGRTLIRSSYQLSYEVAQELFDGKVSMEEIVQQIPELQGLSLSREEVGLRVAHLQKAVCDLVETARVLQERRNRRGGLVLEGMEVKVQMSSDKTTIEDLIPKQHLEMHETIAECMIFANHWVAKKIYESFPSSALLRCHPPPREDMFSDLLQCAASRGYLIDTSSNVALASSLDAAIDPNDPVVNQLLRMLATRAMVQALYCSTGSYDPVQLHHYGLALDYYTHFTSPIRRYSDLVVHRQLFSALDICQDRALPGHTELQEICQHLNNTKRASKAAQQASTELFQALYFLGEGERTVTDGVVYAIRSNGVLVFLPRYGLRSVIYLKDKSGLVVVPQNTRQVNMEGSIVATDHTVTVAYPEGGYRVRVFDHVTVRVRVEEARAHAHAFQLELLSIAGRPAQEEGDAVKCHHSDIVKTVMREAESQMQPRKSTEPSQYSQSSCSLYSLLQAQKGRGILDNYI